jgi:hypothetical protein
MPETGFSIWLGAFCATQSEAAKSLGITDRSVRRYKKGEREVPKPVAKLMLRMVIEGYRPETPIQLFHDEWPDCANDARALRDSIIMEMWSSHGARSPDADGEADMRTAGPDKSDMRTDGPDKSDGWTDGPLKLWFSRWRPSAGRTG